MFHNNSDLWWSWQYFLVLQWLYLNVAWSFSSLFSLWAEDSLAGFAQEACVQPTHTYAPQRMPLTDGQFFHKCDYINHQWIKPRNFSYETFVLAQEHTVSERSVTWNYHSWLGRVPPANKDNAFVLAENVNKGESSLTKLTPWVLKIFYMGVLSSILIFYFQFSSAAQSCPTLCDSMNRSMPGFPVHHQLPESTQNFSLAGNH